MDVCEFSYISRQTNLPATALGIERSGDSLKAEFNRSGPGIAGATYYKTISVQGPQIFAVVDENRVFYHDDGQWHRYITACNVRFGRMDIPSNVERAKTDDEAQVFPDPLEDKCGVQSDDTLES